jgi:hypothetical protein
LLGEGAASTNAETTILRVCRVSRASCGVFAVVFLTGHQAWPRAPQASQDSEAQRAAQPQHAPQTKSATQNDLTKVNIEDLMNIEVTSVSKKEQKLSRVAAAIFAITQENIRRSGATNIPDLLCPVLPAKTAEMAGTCCAAGFGRTAPSPQKIV